MPATFLGALRSARTGAIAISVSYLPCNPLTKSRKRSSIRPVGEAGAWATFDRLDYRLPSCMARLMAARTPLAARNVFTRAFCRGFNVRT